MMRKIQKEQIRSIDVKQEALDDIYAHFDEFHKTTVWQEECRSWFKDGKVKNRIYLWPGSVSFSHPASTALLTIYTDHPLPEIDQRSTDGGLQHQIPLRESLRIPRKR